MISKLPPDEKRTAEQIEKYYKIEKKLADKLRKADKKDRQDLYISLYYEFYKRVPVQPQLIQKKDPQSQKNAVYRKLKLVERYLKPETIFLEVGPGDCSFSFEAAKHVKKAYAIDVSKEISKSKSTPSNFELIISDSSSIPLPEKSVDAVYSNQLMEHLHPEDVIDQLHNIYKVLKPGGIYICMTPNRLSGPHDISKYFDEEATGFHLKEYTFTEINKLFKKTGFSKIISYFGGQGKYIKFPGLLIKLCESFLKLFPFSMRVKISRTSLFRAVLGITIVGVK